MVLATSQNGTLLAVDPVTGSQEPLASGLTTRTGWPSARTGGSTWRRSAGFLRVDPDGGDVEVVADLPGNSFDGLTFSPDYTRLYFNEELGQIHYVDFDADGNPGTPRIGASIPLGGGGLGIFVLDGMAADACGNLYVVQMSGTIWRVRVDDGTVEEIVNFGGLATIPRRELRDCAGFRVEPDLAVRDHASTGAVYEVDVGVPGKWEPTCPEGRRQRAALPAGDSARESLVAVGRAHHDVAHPVAVGLDRPRARSRPSRAGGGCRRAPAHRG